MENQLAIFTAAFATHVAKNHGPMIRSYSYGRRPKVWPAHACCMSYRRIRSTLTNAWPSSGLNLRELVKKESRLRNCCRIKPDFAHSIDESMCSTTAQSFVRWKNKNRCGRPEPRMVIMPGRSAFSSMNWCAGSLENRWQSTGETGLASLSNSICGSVCQKKRILEWQ